MKRPKALLSRWTKAECDAQMIKQIMEALYPVCLVSSRTARLRYSSKASGKAESNSRGSVEAI